jgi:transcriptional regulator with XRE-family HTH domain
MGMIFCKETPARADKLPHTHVLHKPAIVFYMEIVNLERSKTKYICTMTANNRTIHQGRNVKRFREMLGIKQDALAADLGDDWNQQRVSLLEQKETIDDKLLQQLSAVLKIPVEAFQNFDEEAAIAYINTFNDSSANHGTIGNNYNCQLTFNPLEKMVDLYERMLVQQKEMVDKLEKLLKKG